jgi:hypothetical protein
MRGQREAKDLRSESSKPALRVPCTDNREQRPRHFITSEEYACPPCCPTDTVDGIRGGTSRISMVERKALCPIRGAQGMEAKSWRWPTLTLYETLQSLCSQNVDARRRYKISALAPPIRPRFERKATFRHGADRKAVPSLQHNLRAMRQVPLSVAVLLPRATGAVRL